MSIDVFINLFDKYGWSGVIAIVVLILGYYFVSRSNKATTTNINNGFDRLTENMVEQNKALIEAVTKSNEKTQDNLMKLVCKSMDKQMTEFEQNKADLHDKSLKKREELGKKVDKIIFDILKSTKAQRVAVLEMHNSKANLDGLAFLWYDVQYEKQQRGISTLSEKAKNLQAINLRPVITRINEAKNHIITLDANDIENIYDESTVLYAHLKELRVTNLVYSGIYNTDTNELIGLISIEYQEGNTYLDEFVDLFELREATGIIEHLYNDARKELEDEAE